VKIKMNEKKLAKTKLRISENFLSNGLLTLMEIEFLGIRLDPNIEGKIYNIVLDLANKIHHLKLLSDEMKFLIEKEGE
jgi:hypothetical protein